MHARAHAPLPEVQQAARGTSARSDAWLSASSVPVEPHTSRPHRPLPTPLNETRWGSLVLLYWTADHPCLVHRVTQLSAPPLPALGSMWALRWTHCDPPPPPAAAPSEGFHFDSTVGCPEPPLPGRPPPAPDAVPVAAPPPAMPPPAGMPAAPAPGPLICASLRLAPPLPPPTVGVDLANTKSRGTSVGMPVVYNICRNYTYGCIPYVYFNIV